MLTINWSYYSHC